MKNWIKLLSLWLIGALACTTTKPSVVDQGAQCCQECQEAFSQSPVGVGASGAQCGAFSSARPISTTCVDYFKANPRTVAECEQSRSEK